MRRFEDPWVSDVGTIDCGHYAYAMASSDLMIIDKHYSKVFNTDSYARQQTLDMVTQIESFKSKVGVYPYIPDKFETDTDSGSVTVMVETVVSKIDTLYCEGSKDNTVIKKALSWFLITSGMVRDFNMVEDLGLECHVEELKCLAEGGKLKIKHLNLVCGSRWKAEWSKSKLHSVVIELEERGCA